MIYVSDAKMSGDGGDDALVGAILEGRFRIEGMLGEGGMGRVYVAEELRLRRRCAVKVLLPEVMADPANIERFLREAQAIAQLQHDNIVDIYHLGEDEERALVFFAMELLEGEDLESRLFARRQRPIAWVDVARWGGEIAGAMAVVHAAGYVHRDLKPSNVFLVSRRDRSEQVKLLDFGIAKLVHAGKGDIGSMKTIQQMSLTTTGAAIGTPYYMSPEQLLGEELDGRSDIYALGVVLFEAISGRPPFDGEPVQVAMQHCNVDPPSLTALGFGGAIPAEVEALVMKMLAKERHERPQTMDEVEAALLATLPAAAAMERRPLAPVSKSTPSMSPTLVFDGARLVRRPRPPPAAPRSRSWVAPALIGVSLVAPLAVVAMLVSDNGPSDEPARGPEQAAPPSVAAVPVTPSEDPPEAASAAWATTTGEAPAGEAGEDATTGSGGDTSDPAEPAVAEEPEDKPTVKVARPPDPIRQITRAAAACRREHKAGAAPKIVVDYVIASDGAVSRATAATEGALGACLAAAVKKAKFPPGSIKLGQKIEL